MSETRNNPERNRIFLTGATGFVGSRLLARLQHGADPVTALVRRECPGENIRLIRGALEAPECYREALAETRTVVHLAAVTGKASRSEYFRVNREGTRALVEAAAAAGVPRFIFVSSVAAGFADQWRYFYAQSKREAERLVAQSGMEYAVVRPTMIFGPQAPVLAGLAKLARLPVTPLFAGGRALAQPIHVDDLNAVLEELLARPKLPQGIVEVAGSEQVSMRSLLRLIAEAGNRKLRGLSFPARPVRALLAVLESCGITFLPLNSGQMCNFLNDSTGAAQAEPPPRFGTVAEILSAS